MNNKCKYFKIKTKNYTKYQFCNLKHQVIQTNECVECDCKVYKKSVLNRSKTPLKRISKKRAKLERNRKSVFTKDLSKCINCLKPKQDLHECIGGFNRLNSIKYDLVVPLCRTCHQNNNVLLEWKLKAQEYFVKKYGYDLFISIFKIDFIEKHKKRTTVL